jgi:hypothetical protein
MQSEWHKYNPKDPSTHPKENTRVEMKDTDGTLFLGGYSRGHFVHGGVISANSVNLPKRWRYAA